MRFDPVSACYAEFGPFLTGLVLEPGEACARVGLASGDVAAMTPSSPVPVRLFVSIPEAVVERPIVYEMIKGYDVVPSIRRANVETHSAWMILELSGETAPATRPSSTSKAWAAR